MYKLHSLQYPDWYRTGTSYCYFYIFEISHHDIVFFIFVFLKIKKSFLKSSRPSLLIKRAALGNLKASFHCTHWHHFFPLKKEFFLPLRLSCKESSTFSPSPSSSGSGDVAGSAIAPPEF